MITSINDKIRNTIIDKTSIESSLLNIKKLDMEQAREVIRLLVLDYYKIKFIEGISTDDFSSLDIFNNSIDELIDNCLENDELLSLFIKSSILFNSSSIVYKIIVMEGLEKYDEDENLMDISKLHLFDRIAYTFNYDLYSFKKYYIDYKESNENKNINFATTFIIDKLLEYKKQNENAYKKFILEFIREFYKWILFINDNGDKFSLSDEERKYLQLIKSNSIDDLIKYIENDYKFLYTLTDNYLYYSTSEKEISKKIIDEYFNNNTDDEMKNKLKQKRD